MQHLLYHSYARDGLLAEQVFSIIETSARDNPVRDLTGFLIYAQDQFLQFLEGPAESLDLLLSDLKADRRHRDLEILYRGEAAGRLLPGWRMQRVDFRPGRIAEMIAGLADTGIPRRVLVHVEAALGPKRAAA